MFWSLASGIVIGAGMVPLAMIGSAIIGIVLLLFANRKIHSNPYILVLNLRDEKAEETALEILKQGVLQYTVKAKTINASGIELTAELRLQDATTTFINRIVEASGVEHATLVSYNGEYMS